MGRSQQAQRLERTAKLDKFWEDTKHPSTPLTDAQTRLQTDHSTTVVLSPSGTNG